MLRSKSDGTPFLFDGVPVPAAGVTLIVTGVDAATGVLGSSGVDAVGVEAALGPNTGGGVRLKPAVRRPLPLRNF